MAQILPRVYLELSITMPWSSLALDGLLELLLGVAPTNKVLYGSDESTDPGGRLAVGAGRPRGAGARADEGARARLGGRRRGSAHRHRRARRQRAAPARARLMETPAEIQERLRGHDCSLVALHFVDTAGMSRVKVIPLRRLETVARSGTGWSDIWAVVTIEEHFAEVPPYDSPSGDARLIPDVSQVAGAAVPAGLRLGAGRPVLAGARAAADLPAARAAPGAGPARGRWACRAGHLRGRDDAAARHAAGHGRARATASGR